MSTSINRRKAISLFARLAAVATAILSAKPAKSLHHKVQWRRLTNEPLALGDVWSYHDPNPKIELVEGELWQQFTEMRVVHFSEYGKPANVALGWPCGDYWRPIALAYC